MNSLEHEKAVQAFFELSESSDPERYKEVCQKYPVQTPLRRQVIRRRELNVGLLGLSASRISMHTASRYDLESLYQDSNDQ